jgi:hypothetical protein
MQERVESSITETFVEHQPLEQWIINTTGFHNAHLLRRCLARGMWAPVPMFTADCQLAKHYELAEQLRGTHSKCKAATAAAAAANRGPDEPVGPDETVGPRQVKSKKRKRGPGAMGKAPIVSKKGNAPKKKGRAMKRSKKVFEEDLEVDAESGIEPDSDEEDDAEDDGMNSDPMDVDSEGEAEEIYIARPTRRPRGQQQVEDDSS